MIRYPNAAKGLKLIFIAEIISIVGAVLSAIPLIGIVGIIVSLASLVLILLGLYNAKMDDEGFDQALILTIVNLVVSFIHIFVRNVTIVGSLFSIATSVISYMIMYKTLSSTSGLLRNIGDSVTASQGDSIWTIIKVCIILSVIVGILGIIPLIGAVIAVVGGLVELVFSIIAYVKYLIFINKSGNILSTPQQV